MRIEYEVQCAQKIYDHEDLSFSGLVWKGAKASISVQVCVHVSVLWCRCHVMTALCTAACVSHSVFPYFWKSQ